MNIGRALTFLAMALAMAFLAIMFRGEIADIARRIGSLENSGGVKQDSIKEMGKDLDVLSKSLRDMERGTCGSRKRTREQTSGPQEERTFDPQESDKRK